MKKTKYVAKNPDSKGIIKYSNIENETWEKLFNQNIKLIPNRACNEFLQGLKKLNLPKNHIPQLSDINHVLRKATGWSVTNVPALISFDSFFYLLSRKQFPVATFIRSLQDFDYIEEPDIFHEIFGHCPLLTNKNFANFTHKYGQIGYNASKSQQVLLARLYWMTVEFGLVNTSKGIRIYGGGILSSPKEIIYSLESDIPTRLPFNLIDALTTPYRIDVVQPIYYVINSIKNLNEIINMDIISLINQINQKKLNISPDQKIAI